MCNVNIIIFELIDKAEAACISNGGIVKNGMPPTTGAYPPKLRSSAKKYCWKEGLYTQPQASAFCAKLSGRLPILHTTRDNEDLGKAAGSVRFILVCNCWNNISIAKNILHTCH